MGATPVRSETLLTLSAMGKGNTATLSRGVKANDRHEITRSLFMFEHYKIIRRINDSQKCKTFELNPEWFASNELSEFLAALRRLDGRYDARAYVDEDAPRRQKSALKTVTRKLANDANHGQSA